MEVCLKARENDCAKESGFNRRVESSKEMMLPGEGVTYENDLLGDNSIDGGRSSERKDQIIIVIWK